MRPSAKAPPSDAPANPRRRRVLAAAGAAALAAIPLDAWLEPGWVEATRHHVPLPGLPARLDGLTIAHLTDLHRGRLVSEDAIARAVATCNRLQPDLVALTGDFVSGPSPYPESCARALAGLRARLGVYAVPGNHDHWAGVEPVLDALRRAGIRVLVNAGSRPAPGLWVAGVDDLWASYVDLGRALEGSAPGEALLVLSHCPGVLPRLAALGRECLCLAGHTHGGQVRIPGVPVTWIPGPGGSSYVSGWYSQGRARLYVSRGLGVVGLRVRFRCRPEIALFTLHPAAP